MGIFDRWRLRKSASSDKVELNSLLDWLGVRDTKPDALSEAVYYSCIKVLSESIGKLPLRLLQSGSDMGVVPAVEHRYYRMLNSRPNRYMSASTFWTYIESCRNHYGNAYALIDTHDPTHPQLWPLDPSSVSVYYDDARLLNTQPDVYYLHQTAAGPVTYGSEEILHFKSHHTADGIVGVPVRDQLAETILGNAKAQKMLNRLYDNGMTAKAVLQYTGSLKEASVDALTKGIEAYAKGEMKAKGIENIIPMPLGMTLTPINLRLADSQFLELRQYTALQIAAAFGVKPNQIGDYTKSSYASAEAQQLSFLTDTLLYILEQYEQELEYKLLSDDEAKQGYQVKFNTSVILRSDLKTQIDTLSTAVSMFIFTPNEARERLDLPAKPGGDELIGNGSTVPLAQLGVQWGAQGAEEQTEEPPAEQSEEQTPEEPTEEPTEEPAEEPQEKSQKKKRKRAKA